jgi:hypothetical protein
MNQQANRIDRARRELLAYAKVNCPDAGTSDGTDLSSTSCHDVQLMLQTMGEELMLWPEGRILRC